jgi:DNA-binding MarR family transcriptional regulator
LGGDDPAAVETADRLHGAAIHILRRLRGEDAASGLSGPQLSALSVIVFGGPITVGELARAEQVRPPTISRLVKGLERAGLVARQRDADDGRVQRLSATDRGRRLLHEGRTRRVEHLARQIRELPAARRAALLGAIEVLEALARPR